MRPQLERVGLVICTAAIALGLLLRAWLLLGVRYVQEDALITARYARDLWEGQGWVYNPGKPVLGTTSPLWTLISAPFHGLLSFEVASVLLGTMGLVCFCGTIFLLSRTMDRWGLSRTARMLALAFVCLEPGMIVYSIAGLEMSFFTLLMVAALHELTSERDLQASLLGGLALFTRPEGALVVVAEAIYLARRKEWRASLRSLALSAAVVLPWMIFAIRYFGSPIPQSAVSKAGWTVGDVTSLVPWAEHGLLTYASDLGGLMIHSVPVLFGSGITVGALGLWFLGAKRVGGDDRALLPVFIFTGYLLTYWILAARLFPWHAFPATLMFIAIVAVGVSSLPSKRRLPGRELVSTAALTFLVIVAITRIPLYSSAQRYEDEVRRPTGEWISRCTPLDADVMLEPIGYVGYFSHRRVIDLGGLVSPEYANLRGEGSLRTGAKVVLEAKPEVLVLRGYETDSNLFFASNNGPMFETASERAAFFSNYSIAATFSTEETREGFDLVVYTRRDLPLACPTTS